MPDFVKNASVALVKCDDYTPERVDKALERALGLVGGMADLIKPGMRVLVKCNMVMRKSPDAAATTHPEVARAVCAAVAVCCVIVRHCVFLSSARFRCAGGAASVAARFLNFLV